MSLRLFSLLAVSLVALPNILLMHFVKGGRRQLKWLENISVRNEDGSFTKEVLEAYEV